MTKFSIITPAFNCQDKIIRTLYSIVGQTYGNWEMFIIDDMSTDNTLSVVNDFVDQHNLRKKINIISREEKFGETRNTHDIVRNLNTDNVVVRVDAGDYITDLGCLEQLHEIYKAHSPAVLWTKHRWSFTSKNISGPVSTNISVYNQPWRSSHMKTFRVRDFLGLNEKNFKDEDGNWIMIACDQAIFLPMMERARINHRPMIFWDKEIYHYDIDLNDPELFKKNRSVKQRFSAEMIRSRGYIE